MDPACLNAQIQISYTELPESTLACSAAILSYLR